MPGRHHVQHDELEAAVADPRQGFQPVACDLDAVALELEVLADPAREVGLVFDHEDPCALPLMPAPRGVGHRTVKTAPCPGPSLWALTRPCSSSTSAARCRGQPRATGLRRRSSPGR